MSHTHRGTSQRTVAALALLILGLTTMLFGFVGSANADDHVEAADEDCVPSDGTDASFSDWSPAGFTAVQHDDSTPPADPDGESGDANPLNLQMLGSMQTEEHLVQAYQPAVPPTQDQWINRQWHLWPGAPVPNSDPAPAPDDPGWQAMPAAPGGQHDFDDHTPNVPYDVSEGGSGLTSWFLWKATFVPGSQGSPEVPEIKHDDYKWQILERTYTPGSDPVICPPDILDSEADYRRVGGTPDCDDRTVATWREVRTRTQNSDGTWNAYGPWSKVAGSDGTRSLSKAAAAKCDITTKPNESSGPNPGGDPGDGEPEVVGIAAAPAVVPAVAPAAAPTAVDAGLRAQESSSNSSTLWILAGGSLALAGLVLGFSPATPRGKRTI